ncbi:MAG: cytosine permease, partial [Deltaproteobacteria bacterium]|nr:cytosine permease [Deltaproteobacteria bacterium]
VGGILIADYFVLRRRQLDLAGLYDQRGPYWFVNGVNPAAMVALLAGIAPCAPGFLAQVGLIELAADSVWVSMYSYAWFISFGIAAIVYLLLSAGRADRSTSHS